MSESIDSNVGEQLHPLRIFDEANEPSRRPRGRGGRGGRGYRGNSRGFNHQGRPGEQQPANGSDKTNQSARGQRRGGRGGYHGGQGGDHGGHGGDFRGHGGDRGGRGGDPREASLDRRTNQPFFSRDKLIRFSEREDIDDVLMDISHSKSGFAELLQKKPDPKLVCHMVQLLRNVSQSSKMANRREIMQLLEKDFLQNLNELLGEVSLREDTTKVIWRSHIKLSTFLKNILQLVTVVITTFSSSLAKCNNVIRTIKDIAEDFQIDDINSEIASAKEVLLREQRTKHVAKEAKESLPESGSRKPSARKFAFAQPSEPPDDFHNISIFPTQTDFTSESRPFLRANRVEGKYDSLATYLDVQFRLLREDYIQPLRNGISEYRSCIKENVPVKKLRDVRLYQSVQILRPVCSSNGINYVLQFDVTFFRNMNWAASRRLLYGSLLCLSKDNFETSLYAVVTDRSEKELKDGNIQVHFENVNEELDIGSNDIFNMIETTAYFEAYRYILEGLHEVQDSIPFQRYIIDCDKTIKPPKYLLGKVPHYDFSCLLGKSRDSFPPVPVLNTQRWPSSHELGLDQTQYEAIKRAITKELSIIQGPPGTGKTFVGLKIAKLLLQNSHIWNEGHTSPILVVCFTNHALDQFLEAIMGFCDEKILRIGGRCKSETLEPFILRNIKRQRKENRERSFRLMQKERDCLGLLRACEQQISEVSMKIKKTTTRIIPYSELEEFMTENQKYIFKLIYNNKPNLSKWLGISDDSEGEGNDSQSMVPIRDIWQQEIIEKLKPIPDHEKMSITDPWSLDLSYLKRAELYKSWVSECAINIQNEIDNSNHSRQVKEQLQQLKHNAQDKILGVETLLTYTTIMSSKLQIKMLLLGRIVSVHNAIPTWLGLEGSKYSIQQIKHLLDTMLDDPAGDNNDEEEGEDLEEDRELDNDDFLFGYAQKMSKPDKRKKSDAEWITEWNERKMGYKVKNILTCARQIGEEKAERYIDVMNIPETTRRELYAYWVRRYRVKLRETVKQFEKDFDESTEKLVEVRDMETAEIMKGTKVIGMTTTGAAKYRKLFQAICPKIIIVEEAAEVLESHIVTSLNANCQHLILIGDHKQLRPSTAVYDLSKHYKMDVSLFERLVRNDVPYVTLEEQHRMRPEISTLLKHNDLYPQLRDHISVSRYDNINGIDLDVQFIDHEESEATASESTSYSNPHEAKYVSSLCQYIMNQGYKSDQITVITPYMGQVFLLRREMPKSLFQGVRITAIDNYQGEENDIILLSLVRSNSVESRYRKRNRIGFVGIENRICVSLSRAKMGLYVIGNFKLLAECSPMWADMIQSMRNDGRVQKHLILRCQNHSDQFVQAANYKDFQKVPNGGCQKQCKQTLPCGHKCPKNCHIVDKEHLKATCTMPCEKIVCAEGHRCTLQCWKKCGACKTMVERILPICKHKVKMPCFKDIYVWECKSKCEFVLSCGHLCDKLCHVCRENGHHEINCRKTVVKDLECGHSANFMCYEDATEHLCQEKCTDILNCNHRCTGKCGTCFNGRIHIGCKSSCKKVLACGHECSFPCTEICPPCSKSCGFTCSHGIPCKKKCWENCEWPTCHQPCAFNCKHQTCSHDCNEFCVNEPCNKLCMKVLDCGHRCRSLCGETCVCIICNEHLIRNDLHQIFDDSSCFIQIPDCRCIIEVGQMDQHMQNDSTRRKSALCNKCLYCSKPIRKHIKRYSNTLKKTRAKIIEKFKIMMGTDIAKKIRISRLKRQIECLKSFGVTDDERRVLNYSLDNPNDYDSLHVTEMKIDCLRHLIDVTNNVDRARLSGYAFVKDANGIVIKPESLRKLIIEGRKFTTKQYWNEIEREMLRLNLGIRLYLRKKKYSVLDPDSKNGIDIMFDEAFKILRKTDLDEKRIKALKVTLETLRDVPSDSKVDARIISKLTIILSTANVHEEEAEHVKENSKQTEATESNAGMKFKVDKKQRRKENKHVHDDGDDDDDDDNVKHNNGVRKETTSMVNENIRGGQSDSMHDKYSYIESRKESTNTRTETTYGPLKIIEVNGSDELMNTTQQEEINGSDELMDSIYLSSDSIGSIILSPPVPPRKSIDYSKTPFVHPKTPVVHPPTFVLPVSKPALPIKPVLSTDRPAVTPRKSVVQTGNLATFSRISSSSIAKPTSVTSSNNGDTNNDRSAMNDLISQFNGM